MFNLGLTQRHDCRLSGDVKEDNEHIVGHCPVLASKRNKIWVYVLETQGSRERKGELPYKPSD